MAETLTVNYAWTKPDPGASANTWGATLNADLDKIDAQVWSLNGQLLSNSLVISRGPDGGAAGSIYFMNAPIAPATTGTQPRWVFAETSETEGAGNTGTNLDLNAYDNSGAFLGNALIITRATLTATFGGAVNVNGNMSIGGSTTLTNLTASGIATLGAVAGNPSFSGNITVAGSATIGGSISSVGLAATNTTLQNLTVANAAVFESNNVFGNAFQIGANSGGGLRWLQFGSAWSLIWRQSDQMLYWTTNGGPGGTQWQPFQLATSGNLFIAGALTQGSDIALKENVAAFDDDPLAIIKSILPKRFNRTATPNQRELGFVAQDIQAALPEAVRAGDDGRLGITETPLVAVLWRAVQKLAQRVEELEARFGP